MGRGEGNQCQGADGIWGLTEVFYILIVVAITQLYVFVKNTEPRTLKG